MESGTARSIRETWRNNTVDARSIRKARRGKSRSARRASGSLALSLPGRRGKRRTARGALRRARGHRRSARRAMAVMATTRADGRRTSGTSTGASRPVSCNRNPVNLSRAAPGLQVHPANLRWRWSNPKDRTANRPGRMPMPEIGTATLDRRDITFEARRLTRQAGCANLAARGGNLQVRWRYRTPIRPAAQGSPRAGR